TNQPQLGFINEGDADLVIVSAHFQVVEVRSSYTLFGYGEVKNAGKVTHCIPLVSSTTTLADQTLIGLVYGPPYEMAGLSSSETCIAPEHRGAWSVVAAVRPNLLSDAREFRYVITSMVATSDVASPSAPAVLSAQRVQTNLGYTVNGQIRSSPFDVNT